MNFIYTMNDTFELHVCNQCPINDIITVEINIHIK